ncbi:MAG: hypothetical protein IT176_03500 [Acidobacteria bacterium]|nr:hypothetical protein [Acidobacteriota bacterium]
MRWPTMAMVVMACGAFVAARPWSSVLRTGQARGVAFESTWDAAAGTSREAVTDAGRWPEYDEFNHGTGAQLLSVVDDGVNGHHALRVEQRGPHLAAMLQVDDVVPLSQSYYVRFYMRNDDTSSAGDHVVTVDAYQYPNLTFMRKRGGRSGWTFEASFYGCGYVYPIGHWGPDLQLANGRWYRFEYFVEYVDPTHVRVHPRVYDSRGRLMLADDDFRQSDYRSATWNGRSDWTLASYYAAGQTFCVEPEWANDFALGNNGQEGARDTGQAWYFSGVQIRTDRWPGPIDSTGVPSPDGDGALAGFYPGDAGIEHDPDVVFAESFEAPTVGAMLGRWSDAAGLKSMILARDGPPGGAGSQALLFFGGGHLFARLPAPIDDRLYVRYYVKYVGSSYRADITMGGDNPPQSTPVLSGGWPNGTDRFSAGAGAGPADRFELEDAWTDMHASDNGASSINRLQAEADVPAVPWAWTCVEQMVVLNDAGALNGEHAIWVNDAQIGHFGPGFPNGSWMGAAFRPEPAGDPFPGFRWRVDPALALTWLQLAVVSIGDPHAPSFVEFDHIVAARRRVGCLRQ